MISFPRIAAAWLMLGALTSLPALGQPNGFCSGALALINGIGYTENTSAATNALNPLPTCQNFFGHGVWFTFTPSANGPVTINTCGSDFDTVLQVYIGSCGALSALVCADDDGPACPGATASLCFTGSAGVTYWILAGGFDVDFGNLHIVAASSPCPSAIVLSGMNSSNGVFRFLVTGPAGSNCVILASTNLTAWQSIATNLIGSGGSLAVADTITIGRSHRYYRAFLP